MLTDLNFLDTGQVWPPKGEADRLKLYEDNKNLFEGKHELVYKDWMRILREDQQAALAMIFNWPKRLSTLWADLLLGEPPEITAGDPDTPEQATADRLINDNGFFNLSYETVIDNSRFGNGLFKVRYDKRGIIEGQPPSCWFPVVNPANLKEITAHVLAWTWTENTVNSQGQAQEHKFLQCEIHTKGQIENRKYVIDGSTIARQLPWEGQETVKTGVDDFLVIPFNNLITTDRVFGLDDYSDIDSILQEMEVRVSQIARILDKHSDPNMYGPESALEYDPATHQYTFKAGGKYFPVDSRDDVIPGYMVWEGQLAAAFNELDRLQQQLYFLTETSPAAFGELKAGLAESGTALKRLMMATLAKVNRIRMRLDPAVKKVLQVAAALEVAQGMPKATKLENIKINWRDGLPEDEKEQHEIENADYIAGTISLESVLKKRGYSGDRLQEELDLIKGAQPQINPPNIDLGGGG